MAKQKGRFSIRGIAIATLFVALLVPSFAYPMGYAIYLPILAMLILIGISIHLLRKNNRESNQSRFLGIGKTLIPITILLAVAFFYFGLLDDINRRYVSATQARKAQAAALGLDNPEAFRTAALQLHSKMISGGIPLHLFGTDARIPNCIAHLKPTQLSADEMGLHIILKESHASVHAFVGDRHQFGNVEICPGLHFWDREVFR